MAVWVPQDGDIRGSSYYFYPCLNIPSIVKKDTPPHKVMKSKLSNIMVESVFLSNGTQSDITQQI